MAFRVEGGDTAEGGNGAFGGNSAFGGIGAFGGIDFDGVDVDADIADKNQ